MLPHLEPTHWFYTLICAWLMFLVLIYPYITSLTFPNEPSFVPEEKAPSTLQSWSWPWE
nr:ATP synthase F0 subunit 8 [Chauliodus sloani]